MVAYESFVYRCVNTNSRLPNWLQVVCLFLIPGSQTDKGGKFQPHYPGAILTVSVKVSLSFLTRGVDCVAPGLLQ